jgi:MinD superfamily P-loop ATPase
VKELVVLSGKGGTGKTSILGSFAALAEKKVLADCDVDASDLHLLLNPRVREQEELWSGQVARIDEDTCSRCGLCEKLCRFGAIDDFTVDPVSCEGCGLCARACPSSAIRMNEQRAGYFFVSDTAYGPLVHARLGAAQEHTGKLVAQVRKKAKELAEQEKLEYILSDGPPGIGCPVISSISGVSLALVVTEPTLSGMHDLQRVQGVLGHFGVSSVVCINKWDINRENTHEIERSCEDAGLQVIGKIPYDDVVTEAVVHGIPVVEHARGPVSNEIERMWNRLTVLLAR